VRVVIDCRCVVIAIVLAAEHVHKQKKQGYETAHQDLSGKTVVFIASVLLLVKNVG